MDQVIANIFTVADIAAAVISVVFIVIVAIFAKIVSRIIGELLPLFPGISSLINNIMLIVIIIIAYSSFDTFVVPFFILHKIVWLYPIIFLLLAILPIYRMIAIIYRNSGNIVYLFRKKPSPFIQTEEGKCPNCKAVIKNDAQFCSKCGTRIEKISKQDIDINRCSNCGFEIDMESDFCSNCGAKIK
jgi:RNA polymerase subunit RPABC4/transcription elongation factor Spt4